MELNVEMLETLPAEEVGLAADESCTWTCSWTCSWTSFQVE